MPGRSVGLRQESKEFSAVYIIAREHQQQVDDLHAWITRGTTIVLQFLQACLPLSPAQQLGSIPEYKRELQASTYQIISRIWDEHMPSFPHTSATSRWKITGQGIT
jgi:hypothetical protein